MGEYKIDFHPKWYIKSYLILLAISFCTLYILYQSHNLLGVNAHSLIAISIASPSPASMNITL